MAKKKRTYVLRVYTKAGEHEVGHFSSIKKSEAAAKHLLRHKREGSKVDIGYYE